MPSAASAAGWINGLPDGVIDQQELDKVLLGWGNSVAALGAAAVPEPTAALLLFIQLGVVVLIHFRVRITRP